MALGTSEIKLILSAVDKASKELDKVNKSLGKIDDTADKAQKDVSKSGEGMQSNFKNLATVIGVTAGVVTAFGVAAKKALDLGREGAQIELTAGKFDRLASSIGTTSQALLQDMREATRGTVSDLDLMSSATDFMALGLAKSRDEVIRLTRVSGALGFDMNQLVLTLTNMTTMRFDALGISVDGFDAKVKKLEKTGLDAATAFRQAFLEQAEAQIEKVGEVADTNAGKIAQFDAAAKNLSSTMKLKLVPATTEVYRELFKLIATTEEELTAMGINEKEIRNNADSYEEYRKSLDKAFEGTEYLIDANGDLIRLVKTQRGEVRYTEEANYAMSESTFELALADQALAEDIAIANEELARRATGADEAAKAQDRLKQSLSDLKALIAGELGKEIDSFDDKMGDLRDKAAELKSRIDELEKKKYLTSKQKEELAGLKSDLEEVSQNITETADAHDAATKRILFNILTQRAEMDGLSQQEYEVLNQIALDWGLIDNATFEATIKVDSFFDSLDTGVQAGIGDVRELETGLTGLPSEHNFTFHTTYTSSGNPPPGVAGGTTNARPRSRGQHGGMFGEGPTLVGETGPELLFLPPGISNIIPNHKTQQITHNWNMTINEAGRVVDPVRSFALLQALAGV